LKREGRRRGKRGRKERREERREERRGRGGRLNPLASLNTMKISIPCLFPYVESHCIVLVYVKNMQRRIACRYYNLGFTYELIVLLHITMVSQLQLNILIYELKMILFGSVSFLISEVDCYVHSWY